MANKFDMNPERNWFSSICSRNELERVLNVQNAQDYILRMRAETIADNMRLYRLFLHERRRYETMGWEWALEKYFTAHNYIDILHHLDKEKEALYRQVAFGSIITNDPNGLIFDTPYGICSTFSIALKYFSQFSCLALFSLANMVPMEVRVQAMRISIRIMLQREALDFEMDPRGIIPEGIQKVITPIYSQQITFIAAHEYSHYINGDLTKGATIKQAVLKAHFDDETDYKMLNTYNISQKKEFAADIGAMTYPKWDEDWYARIY